MSVVVHCYGIPNSFTKEYRKKGTSCFTIMNIMFKLRQYNSLSSPKVTIFVLSMMFLNNILRKKTDMEKDLVSNRVVLKK